MDSCRWHLLVATLFIGSAYYLSSRDISEADTCPLCYGSDYCSEFKSNVSLRYRTLTDVLFNLFSVKNVYFARNGDVKLVIKKLASTNELATLNQISKVVKTDILNVLNKKFASFQVCDIETAQLFLDKFAHKDLSHLWMLLKVNAEPLLLETFRKQDGWPVPKLYGYCGRAAVVEDSGTPLNDIESFDWFSRAYVALQLLKAAKQFTFEHREFRLYLTDISPDNIAVDAKLRISFVDLEHCVLQKKVPETTYHYTEHLSDEEYGFSSDQICGSSVSDHNVYAVCRLLLSPSSPWPMMRKGLLHSPPSALDVASLFEHIELCVYSQNGTTRFFHEAKITALLGDILNKAGYFATDRVSA